MDRLYAVCVLTDGFHWLITCADGKIVEVSPYSFANEADAILDVKFRV